MADFKFGINNRVWFLPNTAWNKDELPDYLYGEIANQSVVTDDITDISSNHYEIWALEGDDGIYDVCEECVYDTLEELQEAVEVFLTNSLEEDESAVYEAEAALIEAKKLRNLSKKMLKRWQKHCKQTKGE